MRTTNNKTNQKELREVWFLVIPDAEVVSNDIAEKEMIHKSYIEDIEGIRETYGFRNVEIFWISEYRDAGFGLEQKAIIYGHDSEIDEFLNKVNELL